MRPLLLTLICLNIFTITANAQTIEQTALVDLLGAQIKRETQDNRLPLPKGAPDPIGYKIDGEKLSPYTISTNLITSAFITSANLNFNDATSLTRLQKQDQYQETDRPAKWLHDLINRPDGIANPMGLHKWTQPIKISTGLPIPYSPQADRLISLPYTENAETEQKIKNIVTNFIPQLEPLVGLPISWAEDSDSDQINVRIIYIQNIHGENHDLSWQSDYKRGRVWISKPNSGPEPFFNFEHKINTKYSFTPSTLEQVEGYLIANPDNSYKFAYCYIWEGHNDNMFVALVKECVLRSLGFPNPPSYATNSFLSIWNSDLETHNSVNYSPAKNKGIPQKLTEMDKILIRLLYSDFSERGDYNRATFRKIDDAIDAR
ncbi:MAG TPA: hypothetical protein EYG18_07185 [Micavibrio sp.]|nr:hypothetical protein [Micavibrio sp.]HIL29036.1 hypothetical protein [Micavibrio sp.]